MAALMKIVIPTIALVIVVSVVSYLWMRSRIGSLTVELPQREYLPNETIEGVVQLRLKQAVNAGELTLALVGDQTVVEQGGEEDRRSTRGSYRQALTLAEARPYQAGETVDVPFSLTVPAKSELDLLPTERFEMDWAIEARLPTEKVELLERVQLIVKYRE